MADEKIKSEGEEDIYKELENISGEEESLVKKFEEFLKFYYGKKIESFSEQYPEKKSLEIDFEDLEKYDPEIADALLENPDGILYSFREALKNMDIPNLDVVDFNINIRIFNLPKDKSPLVRDITASHLNKLISVEGVVRQITDVLPKLNTAVWECLSCGERITSLQGDTKESPVYCYVCKGKKFKLILEKSEFINFQKMQIQEPLENIKGGEQAKTLEIHVRDDIVNKAYPGEKVEITGILRLRPPRKGRGSVYERYLEGMHIKKTEQEFEELEIEPEEEEEIRKLAARPDIYDFLIKNFAPSIFGYEDVKETIILQMFSGVPKTMMDKTKIRGNIHVLLIGDPGTAKSQLLKTADMIAPKSIYVSGKTSSAAGLTATAVKDEFGEGGWTLKAGALVLANGGLAMLDEFEKMDPIDRDALHEAMEQMSTSIAKAGIITRFKTETSVLAAANPKFGRFDPHESIIPQFDIPVTLLSRFDLYFVIRDIVDYEKDRQITEHILKTHKKGELYERYKKEMTGELEKRVREEIEKIGLDVGLLRKYISYARTRCFPELSAEACEEIKKTYLDVRKQSGEGRVTITPRQLEALIRLSEASARVKLRNTVNREDVERAKRLLLTSLKQVGTDIETGKLDTDIIATGISASQRKVITDVLQIIKELFEEEKEEIEEIKVIEKAKTQGMEEPKIREALRRLKRQGEIFEPTYGKIRPTT